MTDIMISVHISHIYFFLFSANLKNPFFSFLEEYPDIRQLALHVSKAHCLVNNDGKTVCLYCTSFQRERIYQVRNHILAAHFNQPDHECKVCGKIFIEQFSLNSHISNQHLKERSYQCGKFRFFF